MQTPTKTIAVRVPVRIVEALAADAAERGLTPGTMLRRMLEQMYTSTSGARNGDTGALSEHNATER